MSFAEYIYGKHPKQHKPVTLSKGKMSKDQGASAEGRDAHRPVRVAEQVALTRLKHVAAWPVLPGGLMGAGHPAHVAL